MNFALIPEGNGQMKCPEQKRYDQMGYTDERNR